MTLTPEQRLLNQFSDNLWRWKCGLPEKPINPKVTVPKDIDETEWCPDFERLMKNRLLMAAFRYGQLTDPRKRSHYMKGLQKKLTLYLKTGNLEALVDCANYCLLEFHDPQHPKAHFEAKDDHSHCPPINPKEDSEWFNTH